MFYTFRQNNSGGVFDYDEERGISLYVIIEARNGREANAKAESIGLYFDGVDEGIDCGCCGDRWNAANQYCIEEEGEELPLIWGVPAHLYKEDMRWLKKGEYYCFVHYANGEVLKFDEE